MNLAASLGAFLLAGLVTASASASYVCKVAYYDYDGSLGDHGYVYFTQYSGPACTGDFEGSFYVCSHNPTSSLCTTLTGHNYSESGIHAQYRAFLDAAMNDAYVATSKTTSCGGSGTSCWWRTWFYSPNY